MLFKVKSEYNHENPLYYHIDKVAVDRKEGNMAYVYDIDDGNYFWIEIKKLELV